MAMVANHTASVVRKDRSWYQAVCTCGWDSVHMTKLAAEITACHHERDPDPERRIS